MERGGSELLLDLLVGGGDAWPRRLRERYTALAEWQGIGALKQRLRRIGGAEVGAGGPEVLLASRSSALMRLAARLLVRSCDTVLTADIGWPPYLATLRDIVAGFGGRVIEVPLREAIFRGAGSAAVVQLLATASRHLPAMGLFLPAISHEGIRLPLGPITRILSAATELRFVAVDGAQHLAHGDERLSDMNCDFYLAGAHKWLRSYFPLGIALLSQSCLPAANATMNDEGRDGFLGDDPLLKFTSQLERGDVSGVAETVNLSPLLSAYGAVGDALRRMPISKSFIRQLANGQALGRIASHAEWQAVALDPALRSGILMLKPCVPVGMVRSLRGQLERQGLTATAYQSGLLRLSLPRCPLRPHQEAIVSRALTRAAALACRQQGCVTANCGGNPAQRGAGL